MSSPVSPKQIAPASTMKPAEAEERQRLGECLGLVDVNLEAVEARLATYAQEIKETKTYMWEARRDLDHVDKANLREMIAQKARSAEILRGRHVNLKKLRASPYFGRVDFARDDCDRKAAPIYIGVHDFQDEETGQTLVYDWRAPISSIFYDFETGPAHYDAPGGEVAGQIERKRQFRIRHGRMELMLETSLNIVDDLLQEELGRTSDEGMRNIVATIQRDQNAIIRDADTDTLIIQGVAGSGKTSIALHRIAFLLYKFKETLSSKDILIISPNRVFADYIGNVLPELGEEQVAEIGMEALADALLGGRYKFENFFEQTARLLENDDAALSERLAAKADADLLKSIDRYIAEVESASLAPEDWRPARGVIVPGWFFEEAWRKHRGMPLTERVREVVAAVEHQLGQHYNYDLRSEQRRDLRQRVRAMTQLPGLRAVYKGFYDWLGRPELFKARTGQLEYADVFPLIYMKMKLEGLDTPYDQIKHLLVDEMQDYTPVQYAVLRRLFPCRKTILGDASQSVSPGAASTATAIREVLGAGEAVKLTRSYRSSWEIMQFALAIAPNAELEPIKRHGEPPVMRTGLPPKALQQALTAEIEAFHASDHRSLAIIAKTEKRARALHKKLSEACIKTQLFDSASSGFSTGVVICAAHLAKGLEFDRVIIPDADAKNYRSELDRNLLYVACTRAMHRLTVLANGKPSAFLPAHL